MEKEDLLQQVYDTLSSGKDLRKIKVKFQDGQVIKFDFDGNQVEVEEVNEEDEDEDEDEEADEDEEQDEEEDEQDNQEQDNGTSSQTSYQTTQVGGRKVNVINR